jgi:hypothetical protein
MSKSLLPLPLLVVPEFYITTLSLSIIAPANTTSGPPSAEADLAAAQVAVNTAFNYLPMGWNPALNPVVTLLTVAPFRRALVQHVRRWLGAAFIFTL